MKFCFKNFFILVVAFGVGAICFALGGLQFDSSPDQGISSDPLNGLFPMVEAVGVNVPSANIFENYLTWTKTTTFRSDDKLLSPLYHLSYFYQATANTSTSQKYSLIDINGDALPDVLYHDSYFDSNSRFSSYLAVFLNQGGLSFNLVYKCVRDDTSANKGFYGDCAGTGGTSYIPFIADGSTTPSSSTLKSTDSMVKVLYRLAYFHSDDASTVKKTPQKTNFMDVNGDGLVDLVFADYTYASTSSRNNVFGVFLNNGNLGFDVSYRCNIGVSGSTNPTYTYSGDCAG